jgi:hypothetical protein
MAEDYRRGRLRASRFPEGAPFRARHRLIKALEWFAVSLVLLVGLMLLVGAAQATPQPSCEVAMDNIRIVRAASDEKIALALKMPKRGSAKRLAVLQAKEARGYYAAMRIMLPLACAGDRLKDLDNELIDEITKLDIFVFKNW